MNFTPFIHVSPIVFPKVNKIFIDFVKFTPTISIQKVSLSNNFVRTKLKSFFLFVKLVVLQNLRFLSLSKYSFSPKTNKVRKSSCQPIVYKSEFKPKWCFHSLSKCSFSSIAYKVRKSSCPPTKFQCCYRQCFLFHHVLSGYSS